ncbi:MAG: YbjN domain-containing protein [Treponema sp.]|jgi:hypothetical protein|nr:YbjN domain-containing protein [Treponema sp.]
MTVNKIEEYLTDLMYSFRAVDDNFWLLEDSEHNLEGVAIIYCDPLVVVRVAVMDAPQEGRLEFFEKLLELNANDMIHGAYAIENGKVIMIDTLEYDTMDYMEFRATLDALSLALTQHFPILSKYREK